MGVPKSGFSSSCVASTLVVLCGVRTHKAETILPCVCIPHRTKRLLATHDEENPISDPFGPKIMNTVLVHSLSFTCTPISFFEHVVHRNLLYMSKSQRKGERID